MKISVCTSCGDPFDYTGYPMCQECIKDGDTTKKEVPKLLQKDKDALYTTTTQAV
jgi:NMD protein affecting ribosome stability and mRNA decay